MMIAPDIKACIILSLSFLSVFALAEFAYHRLKIKVELTRKFVHISTGIITLLFPVMLSSHWYVLFLCTSFLFILLISLRWKFLPSINNIDRKSFGSISYPIAVYSCFYVFSSNSYQYIYFYLPILILAFADPMAALFGKRWPIGKYTIGSETKTLVGSFAFLCTAFLVSMVLYNLAFSTTYALTMIVFCIAIAISTMVAEALSRKGLDNLTVPYTALLMMIIAT